MQIGSGVGADASDPLYLAPFESKPYLYFPGVVGNYGSIPDGATVEFGGDLDFRVLADTFATASYVFASKYTTAGNRSFIFGLNGSGQLLLSHTIDGTTLVGASAAALITIPVTRLWMRVTRRASDGRVQFFTSVAYDPDTFVGVWTKIGGDITPDSGGLWAGGVANLDIGSYNAGVGDPLNGNIYRLQMFGSLNETNKQVDVDFTDISKYNSTRTTHTAVSGQTVTINRAVSGRKTTVVDRALFLFGVDDYMETPDDPGLDFGAAESFTAAIAFRKFHNPPPGTHHTFMAKTPSFSPAGVGWGIYHNVSSGSVKAFIADGAVAAEAVVATALPLGDLTYLAARRDVISDKLGMASSYAAVAEVADPTTATLINASTLRIGARPAGSDFADMVFFGAALLRRALTDAEIVQLGQELLA